MDREKVLKQIMDIPEKSRFLVGYNEMAKDLSKFMIEDEVVEAVSTAYTRNATHYIKNGRMMRSFIAVTNKNVYVIARGRMILNAVSALNETIVIPRNEIVGIEERDLPTHLKIMYDGDISIVTRTQKYDFYMGVNYKKDLAVFIESLNEKTEFTEIKYCSNCGTKVEINALFCPECGSSFES